MSTGKENNMTHDEKKAQQRANYYANYEHYKKYREERKKIKAEYDRKYREENPDKIKQRGKNYHSRVKTEETYIKRRKDYAAKEENKERRNELARISTKKRPDKVAAKAARRRTFKQKATPPWLTKEHFEEIQEFYTLAQELAWLNEGEVFHVDHIIPIRGKNVCGLHVPWNLQLLPATKNLRKSNKLI